jgi:hypothetical protein
LTHTKLSLMKEFALPIEFQESYVDYLSYPENVILHATNSYASALGLYKQRFDAIQSELCLDDEEDVEVGFRDLGCYSGKGIAT